MSPMSQLQQISAQKIFTGEGWLLNAELLLQSGKIVDIRLTSSTPQYEMVVPSFIDLQIYGAFGQLLSVYPNVESLSLLYKYCMQAGTSHFLPTIATNTSQVMSAAIQAVRDYWKEGGQGCLGLHLEGPWLHPAKRGAHVETLLQVPTKSGLIDLLQEGKDVIKIITLAPEVCDRELIELINDHGVKVSAGHSNASFEEASRAFHSGVSLATHLYNAMSPLQHRAPGMVGAIFCAEQAMASIIPDGYHVDWPAIQIAKKQLGDRLFVITDAVTDTTAGPYPHQLGNDRYEAGGILSGSSLTMLKALNNLIRFCHIDLEEALRMCSLYPARALGLDQRLGKLAPGYDAHWTALSRQDAFYTLANL